MRRLRREEEWARRLIATELGVQVQQHDDGSRPGMHDLDAVLSDGRRAAIEVTAAVDPAATELWGIVNGAGRWIEPALAGGWAVRVTPGARRLRRDLPPFLRALEDAGISKFPDPKRGTTVTSSAPFGVTQASQSGTEFPGSIYVLLDLPQDQVSGFVAPTGDALAGWIGAFLRESTRTDIGDKLARSGASERHAFVIVSGLSGAPFSVTELLMRDDAPLPTVAPDLPRQVTDVWIVSTWDAGLGIRWASNNQSWSTFSKF